MGIRLARRLGLLNGLPAPLWMLPDPDLSGILHRILFRFADSLPSPELVATCHRVLRVAGGRKRLPRCLDLA
ncbi:hypothetical protein [Siccirubricoccus sp. G192]|uniref:hypothetical protein n=1 Tax=Siccirubricoccus sp. G192 TaxID=2849651 RepID=UPI001C2C3667|nr:hypothetical protein [Siccirubricoccus sp. G192]MBV1799585.1 hypothetical protein [Siccirubricoccus sp. G192]